MGQVSLAVERDNVGRFGAPAGPTVVVVAVGDDGTPLSGGTRDGRDSRGDLVAVTAVGVGPGGRMLVRHRPGTPAAGGEADLRHVLAAAGADVTHVQAGAGADALQVRAAVEAAWWQGTPVVLTHSDPLPGDGVVGALCDSVVLSQEFPTPLLDGARYRELAGTPAPPDTDLRISVVVTTLDRTAWLRRCLAGFRDQTLATESFEVVVVDDGSVEDVAAVTADFADLPLRLVRHGENRGMDAARNTGIDAATGDVILCFDDDDAPGRRLLAEHLRTHARYPQEADAVLGFTGWAPDVEVNSVMYHVTVVGREYFSYPGLRHGAVLPWHCLWGGRSSVKASLLKKGRFRTSGMFGDMDFAWRHRDRLRVVFNRHAVQHALRPLDFGDVCRRSYAQGRSAHAAAGLHDDPAWAAYLRAGRSPAGPGAGPPALEALEELAMSLGGLPLDGLRRRSLPGRFGNAPAEAVLHGAYAEVFEHHRRRGLADAAEAEAGSADAAAAGGPHGEALRLAQGSAVISPRPVVRGLDVLVVNEFLPLDDRDAGSRRLLRILGFLRDDGHRVTYVSHWDTGRGRYSRNLDRMGIDVHFVNDPSRPDDAGPDVDRLLEERAFDLAYLHHPTTAADYGPEIRRLSPRTRVLVDSVDLAYVRLRREVALNPPREPAEVVARTLANLERRELDAYAASDGVVAITDTEAATLRADLGARGVPPLAVVPNIHEAEKAVAPFASRRGLLFVGNFVHRPNLDAMEHFLRDVLPLVHAVDPAVRVEVVGHGSDTDLGTAPAPGVRVLGHVTDLRPHLARARVSIAPLRFGAGMKGKICEAMAAGIPVVTTTVGAEGMQLEDGGNALVADGAEDFAQAVLRLHTDADLWERISRAGRAWIGRLCSPDRARRALQDLVVEAVAPRTFVAVPDWGDVASLRRLLSLYLGAFREQDPVRLVLGVPAGGPDTGEAGGRVAGLVDSLGWDPEQVPDVFVNSLEEIRSEAPPEGSVWIGISGEPALPGLPRLEGVAFPEHLRWSAGL